MYGIYERGYSNQYGYYYKHNAELEESVRKMIQEEINIAIPKITAAISKEIENGVSSALRYDVQTLADVSIDGVQQIVSEEKVSSFVSGAVEKELEKRIKNINIKLF